MRMLWFGLVLAHFSFCSTAVPAEVTLPAIEQITILSEPPSMRIQLDRPAPFRAVRVDPREVMVAFKGVQLSEKLRKQGEGGRLIREFTIERLRNHVVALMVVTEQDIGEIKTVWDESVNTLTVELFPAKSERPVPWKTEKEESKKTKSLSSKRQQPEPVSKAVADDAALPPAETKAIEKPKVPEPQAKTPPVVSTVSSSSIPAEAPTASVSLESPAVHQVSPSAAPLPGLLASPFSTGKMTDSGNDLLLIMDGASCSEQTQFQEALRQSGKKNWREAFQLLSADLQSGSQNNCRESEYYLRAYAYHKLNQQGDEGLYLEALNYFQDAVSYFPDSVYAPYALASIAKIYKELKNYAEAKGYLKIILEKYKDYPGRPEVMFNLGQIYGIEKNVRMSIPIFKDILTNYPDKPFAVEVRLELGKALYNYHQYSQSLEMLNDVLAKEPRKAFELEDVLLYMGNSYYQLGKFQESRDALIRAFNLFPNADDNPLTLTRIGDILRDTGQPDKANKLYQIVMDRFPGTDGCVISAMRRAALLEERTEKENIYRMVMAEYPNHPMASLAVVKLSDLQYKAGQYRNSVETLRPLFIANPKNLRAELSYIMQASFKGLLSEMIKADVYPEIIAISQKEGLMLSRFEQPEVFRMLGLAHLKGHLHAEAAKFFEKADKYFGTDGPPELYYEYGTALRESGDVQLALKKLQEYLQKAPQGEHAASAYFQMGRLMIDQKDGNGALSVLKKADALSKAPSEKIDVLRLTAKTHRSLGDFKTAAHLLIEVVNLLSSATEKDAGMFFDVYRELGENYIKMKSNAEAVKAFEMALKYSGKAEPPAVLVQLGEAYQKTGQGELAMKIYNQVLALDDEFWKNVARERLQRMQVENRIKTDAADR